MIHSGDFLGRIMARLHDLPTEQWADITVLLPGRRAARKLADALAGTVPPGTWLPRFTTLGEWSAEVQRVSTPSKLELLVELQQVAESMRADLTLPEWDSFERFQPWGLAALGDFNNIDHHLLEARQVFRDLRNIKDIEAWSFGEGKELKPGQLRFLAQWNALLPLYEAFHAHLRSVGSSTMAGLMRRMEEEEGWLGQVTGTLWMAGANAMTPAERRTVEKLVRAGKAEWIWDTDPSYVRNDMEAGRFIREMVPPAQWQELPHPMEDATLAGPEPTRQWNMVTCSSRTLQAQYIRACLQGTAPDETDRIGIILPSADLAPTVMTAMPPSIAHLNLTMGVPLDRTPLRSFLSIAFGLQHDRGRLHHSRVRALLAHPFTRTLHPEAAKRIGHFTRHCAERSLIRMKRSDLADFPEIEAILAPWWAGQEAARQTRGDGTATVLAALAEWTDRPFDDLKDPWLASAWSGFRDLVALHLRCVDRLGREPELSAARAQLQRWMGQQSVDIAGEPFKGLQVMGLLESRGLDFDEVFVLDVNEGILPDGSPPPTFMPLDLQRAHGLPGRPERDGIFAAYLHRLLHRARKVHLVHVGADLGDGATEPSRHIAQLTRWAQESLPGVDVKRQRWSTPLPDAAPPVPDLQWSDTSRQALDHLLLNGISPSALNQAIRCNRQFHYRYVLGLGEADTVEEHLEASTIGTVIHKAVELGLEGAIGRDLERSDLQRLAKEIQPRLAEALALTKPGANPHAGENVLVLRMAAAMIGRWVRDELRGWPRDETVHLVGMEDKLRRTFTMEDGRTIAFRGVADRVERRERGGQVTWQVLDYKTGKVEGKELALGEDWETKLRDGQHGKALQLLLYAAMLRAHHPTADGIRSTIRAGRKGQRDKDSLLTLRWEGQSVLTEEHDLRLQGWLRQVVADLLPEAHDGLIRHDEESQYCADCLVLE